MSRPAKILAEIEALISVRLSGPGPWLPDRETAGLLHQRIWQMGLTEPVPGEPDAWQRTPLGKELDVALLEVFLGLWEPLDAFYVLKERGFVDTRDAQEVQQLEYTLCEDGDHEELLKPYVVDAYRRRHGNA